MNEEKVARIVAEIKAKESEDHKHKLGLAWLYRDLIDECGSARQAAEAAKTNGLQYAHHGNMTRLIFWAEIVDAIGMDTAVSTLTEWKIRPVLTPHFEEAAGPGGLADVWDSLREDEQTAKAFIKAAHLAFPPPPKPKKKAGADTPTFRNLVKKNKGVIAEEWIPELIVNSQKRKTPKPDDQLAEAIARGIVAVWGSLDAFLPQAKAAIKQADAQDAQADQLIFGEKGTTK